MISKHQFYSIPRMKSHTSACILRMQNLYCIKPREMASETEHCKWNTIKFRERSATHGGALKVGEALGLRKVLSLLVTYHAPLVQIYLVGHQHSYTVYGVHGYTQASLVGHQHSCTVHGVHGYIQASLIGKVANPPGMGGRLPEFNSISRLPPGVAQEMIISQNAPNLVLYNGSILKY